MQLVSIEEFKDTSAGRMLLAVTHYGPGTLGLKDALVTHNITALLQKY